MPSSAATAEQILVVDDDPFIREALVDVLADAGYPAEAVANGDKALRWLDENADHTGLVFLDLMMPVMDGREFLRRKRTAAPALSELPVVVITAGGECDDILAAHLAEACLNKPVSAERLLEAVRAFGRAASAAI